MAECCPDICYPSVDWEAHAWGRVPSLMRAEPTWAVMYSLVEPLGGIDAAYEALACRDAETATGVALTQEGDLWGCPRGGITDDDLYRRLVLAARNSIFQVQGTDAALWSVWTGLTGAGVGTATVTRVVTDDPDPIYGVRVTGLVLNAVVDFAPTFAYLAKAGESIRRSVDASAEVNARFVPNGGFTFDTAGAGFDAGLMAWSIFL